MSEAGLWLLYLLAGVLAAAAVGILKAKSLLAIVASTSIALAIWTTVSFVNGGSIDDPWFGIGLFINGAFAAVAAGIGAAIIKAFNA